MGEPHCGGADLTVNQQVFVEELQLQGKLTPEEFLRQRETALEKLFPTAELMPGAERLLRHLVRHLSLQDTFSGLSLSTND